MNDIQLELIESMSQENWDEEATLYDTWRVFHSSAWLYFIEKTQCVKRTTYAILSNGQRVGLLPGFIVNKGPLRIFGSPLPGWTTPYLGPLVNDIDQFTLLSAIAKKCRHERYCHAEIECPQIDVGIAIKSGYKAEQRYTYIAPLQSDPETILANFSKSCRKAVRRAQRDGLQAETTDDPMFIDIYYNQLQEVFAKHNMIPTYPKSRIKVLWEIMKPTGRLITTWVRFEEKIIATRIDIISRQSMYSFGSASDKSYHYLYPNELARYHTMCVGASKGLIKYDMNGGGSYKAKFGAEYVSTYKIILSSRLLMVARNALKIWNQWKVKQR